MKSFLKPLLVTSALTALFSMTNVAAAWTMWDQFKDVNIDKSYRVIDYSDSRSITTSEGQSYAMFFALVADDRPTFDKLLEWTEKNLSRGDITKHLPSWLWGRPPPFTAYWWKYTAKASCCWVTAAWAKARRPLSWSSGATG